MIPVDLVDRFFDISLNNMKYFDCKIGSNVTAWQESRRTNLLISHSKNINNSLLATAFILVSPNLNLTQNKKGLIETNSYM